jgi:hypothetical protein
MLETSCIDWPCAPSTFLDFFKLGVAHIGALPSEWINTNGFHLPEGLDHIFFVLALILGRGSVRSLLISISGFTIGHSITLALSTLHYAEMPSHITEPLIALSIVYVATEAALLRSSNHRWLVSSTFGLFHGFGFATALKDLHLGKENLLKALLGFNLGVETGQLTIVFIVLPFFLALQKEKQVYEAAVRSGATGVALTGAYWFFTRI